MRKAVCLVALASGLALASGAQAAPIATPSPATLDFGNVQVGAPPSWLQVSIQNTGDTTLTLGSTQIVGSSPAVSYYQLGFTDCGGSLDPGVSCVLQVGFQPQTPGTHSATLSLASDDPASPLGISLSGVGTAPHVGVAPTSIDFGEIEVGTASAGQAVTVTNDGSGTLFIGGVWIQNDSGDYTIDSNSCSGVSLAAGETCSATVIFAPRRLGARSATLVVDSNSGSSFVALEGLSSASGTAVLVLSPSTLDFGPVPVGSSSELQVQATNTGDGTLVFGGDDDSGTNLSGAFDQFDLGSATCRDLLGPGETCFATFIFHPTSDGQKVATFWVPSNAVSAPTALELRGYGGTPPSTPQGSGSQPQQQQPTPLPAGPMPPAPNVTQSEPSVEPALAVRWQQPQQPLVIRLRRTALSARFEVSRSADIRISLKTRGGLTVWSITTSVGRAGAYQVVLSRQLLRTLHGRYKLMVTATQADQTATASLRLSVLTKKQAR